MSRHSLAGSKAQTTHHRASVLRGEVLSIEYRDGGENQRIEITPGQVEWEEPTEPVHRTVNVGKQVYEQVTVFT